jgi:hypothetical protein
MNSNHRSSSTKSHEDEEGSDSSPLVPRKSVSPSTSKLSAAASRRHRRPAAVQRNASDRVKQEAATPHSLSQPHTRTPRRRASLHSDVSSAAVVDVVRVGPVSVPAASNAGTPVMGTPPLAPVSAGDDDTLIRRSRRPSPLFEVLATAAASSGDSESTVLKDGSDENSTVAAASKHGSSSLSRRSSRASVLSDVLSKNRHSEEFRSATTSETTATGSFLVAHSTEHNNATSSASPLPDSGASVAVGDDSRLWIGDLKQVERIISFQRSSSGRHGISETASGRLITHPIVLTGPSPSKDDDDASSTTLSAGLPPRSQQLSFGSSLSSSDLDDARNAPATKTKAAAAAAASRASSRRRHRVRPVVLPTIDSAAKDLHDVLHAMGVTSLVVPDAVIVDLVLAPTSIAALDNEALHDARSDDEPDSASESSAAAAAAVAASSPSSSTSCSPGDVLGPLLSRSMSPEKPQSPPPPLVLSSPPRSRNNSATTGLTSKSPPRSATPSGGDSLTYVTVDDRRERIVSMRTSRSGRHTVTQTESGTLITQPVFFSPGGVVQTDTVPIYMAEGASRRRSER